MLGTASPGVPAWQTSWEQLQPVLHESLNFFYVNVGLAQLGLNPVPSIAEHPVGGEGGRARDGGQGAAGFCCLFGGAAKQGLPR